MYYYTLTRQAPGHCAAEDEYYLPTQLPKEIYEERIRMHRSEYITERRSSDV